MALRIPYVMFTAVDSITGLESEPLLYSPADDDDQIRVPTITATEVFRVDTLNSDAGYPAGSRKIAVRLNFTDEVTEEAFKSGLYGSFVFSGAVSTPFRLTVENRVVRLTEAHLTIPPPPLHHGDFIIEGNFIIPDTLVRANISGVSVWLASPLFTDAIKHEPNATKKAVQADLDAGKASQLNQIIADEEARTPKTFDWDLPRIPNADHYVLYVLGSDSNFHEADITIDANYKIGEEENYVSIFDLANEEGRRYTVGRFPFKTPDDYPGAVGFYNQRKIFASTNRKPDTIWFSEVGNYDNFITDTGDSDPIEITVASNRIERINHITPFGSLFFFTEGGVWAVSEDTRITPAEISLSKISEEPAAENIEPFVLDGNIIFGSYCRDDVKQLVYSFSENSYNQFKLNVLARHLFVSPIRFQSVWEGPIHQLACVNAVGDILIAAISKKDNIVAWGKWTRVDHKFQDVLADPSGSGFYVISGTPETRHLEHIRLSTCLPPGSTEVILPVYQDNSTNYPFTMELLPFENEGIGIRDQVSISDIFLKVSSTERLTASIGSSTFSYPDSQDPSNFSSSVGTIILPIEDDWDRDSKLSITDTSSESLEILSVAAEGRIAQHENVSDVAESFNIPLPQKRPKPEEQPIQKGTSQLFENAYEPLLGVKQPEEQPIPRGVNELFEDVYNHTPKDPEPREPGQGTPRQR